MGNRIFGVDISGIIAKEVGGGVLDATLNKKVTGAGRTPGSLSAGINNTETAYACKGFIDKQRIRFMSGTLVKGGSLIAVLIGDTISSGTIAPEPGDEIVLEGTTYVIPEDGTIDRDPAAAVYECEVRAQ